MTKNISYSIILLTLIIIISTNLTCKMPASSWGRGGPLFLQVHYTNRLSTISNQDLTRLLKGKVRNFSEIGGSSRAIHLYSDSSISDKMRTEFPDIDPEISDMNNSELRSKRSFLGITDIRGLKPFFKTLYIDNRLPWGKKNRDYTLASK